MSVRELFRFDRVDRIGTELLVVVLWLGAVLALVARPLWRWATDRPLLTSEDASALGLGDLLDGPVRLRVADATAGDRLLQLAPGVVLAVLLGVGAWLLVALLRSITAGRPFDDANTLRLRLLAGLLVAAPFVVAAVEVVTAQLLASRLGDGASWGFSVTVDPTFLVAGLVCAALAQAFAAGTRLQRDSDGLV